jgi:serine/threonine-protein kinase
LGLQRRSISVTPHAAHPRFVLARQRSRCSVTAGSDVANRATPLPQSSARSGGSEADVVATKLLDAGAGRQRIDRYELVGEIASGGMATVYLARLTGVGGFQRFVAIKRLHPHLAAEEEFVQMFLDEARLAAAIHHPNVVPILEVGASPLGYYLVMEYIEGDTLARLLARAATANSQLPPAIGLRIVLDMLAGLHTAHELRDEHGEPTHLVHRDVSPQNVLVGTDGIGRITDFGVARAASRLSETRVGQLKGKIAYMAPEQAMGAEELDRRADVFSAGVVTWEVLSAKRLFKAENDAATLTKLISEDIPALTEVASGVGERLSQVVSKALERDPDKRYGSCAEFADALEEAGVADAQVGTSRDLAAYVARVIGNEIAQQREAVRAWLARSEPSHGEVPERWPAASPPSSGTMPGAHSGVTTHPSHGSAPTHVTIVRQSMTPLVIALGAVAALLVVVIFLLVERTRPPPPTVFPDQPVPTATAVPRRTATTSAREPGDDATPEESSAEPATPTRPAVNPRRAPGGEGDLKNPYR